MAPYTLLNHFSNLNFNVSAKPEMVEAKAEQLVEAKPEMLEAKPEIIEAKPELEEKPIEAKVEHLPIEGEKDVAIKTLLFL